MRIAGVIILLLLATNPSLAGPAEVPTRSAGPAGPWVVAEAAPRAQSPPPQRRDWHWRMLEDGWHSGLGYGHWGFSLVFWGVLLAVVVLAVWALAASPRTGGGGPPSTPREILDARYARGEIDRDEYLRRRGDLES